MSPRARRVPELIPYLKMKGDCIVTETTRYRLYLKLKLGKRLDSTESSVTALVGGRTVTIQSDSPPQLLSEALWLVMDSGGFETPDQAREFGEALRRAAHLAGLCSRAGVDAGAPGDDRQQSWVNPEIFHSVPGVNPELRVGPDVHGIVILPDDGNTVFCRARADLAVRYNSGNFLRTLEEALPGSNPFESGRPSIRRAIRVMNLAEITRDPITKVVLSVPTSPGCRHRRGVSLVVTWSSALVCTQRICGGVPRVVLVIAFEPAPSIAGGRRCRPFPWAPAREDSGSAIRGEWLRVSREILTINAICRVPHGIQPQALVVWPVSPPCFGVGPRLRCILVLRVIALWSRPHGRS